MVREVRLLTHAILSFGFIDAMPARKAVRGASVTPLRRDGPPALRLVDAPQPPDGPCQSDRPTPGD